MSKQLFSVIECKVFKSHILAENEDTIEFILKSSDGGLDNNIAVSEQRELVSLGFR